MGVGHLIGVDDEHLAVSGHDLHAYMRELVQDVKDGRRRLLAVQRRAVQHRLGGEIIQQRPVAGDGRQRQADVPQRRADGLRRAARCHREKPPHAGVQLDDRAVAGGDALLGRQQRIIHITDHKGIA